MKARGQDGYWDQWVTSSLMVSPPNKSGRNMTLKVSSLDTASFCELGFDTVVIDQAFSSRVLNSILDLLPETEGFVDLKKVYKRNPICKSKQGLKTFLTPDGRNVWSFVPALLASILEEFRIS